MNKKKLPENVCLLFKHIAQLGSRLQTVVHSMIFLTYLEMHFSSVKLNILCRWSNILCDYVHTRTFFTPKIHPPLITWPTTWPCPPPDPARHPALPATPPCPPPHPARHPTSPATTPCLRPRSSSPLSPGHDCDAIVATRWCHPRCSAKAVCVGWRSLIIYMPYLITKVPYPIFYIPYLIFYTPHLIFYVPYLIFYVPYLIFYVPYLIFYIPYQIFYVTLICDVATVDTLLARPLPPGVVNCPCVTLAFPCPVELGASQVSVHSSAPEMLWGNRRLKLQTLVDVWHLALPIHTQSVTTQYQQKDTSAPYLGH